ncbi:MAG: hypothetical protein EBY21_14860 [Alphaproteobacteria bacterium]|nr:hypothetical protein [Alphaproteobacteria bacterium]
MSVPVPVSVPVLVSVPVPVSVPVLVLVTLPVPPGMVTLPIGSKTVPTSVLAPESPDTAPLSWSLLDEIASWLALSSLLRSSITFDVSSWLEAIGVVFSSFFFRSSTTFETSCDDIFGITVMGVTISLAATSPVTGAKVLVSAPVTGFLVTVSTGI